MRWPVNGEERLAGKLRHAVVEESCPLAAFGRPVHAAVEAGGAVETVHIGTDAEAHAEAFALFT
jgi:hypothetical protein